MSLRFSCRIVAPSLVCLLALGACASPTSEDPSSAASGPTASASTDTQSSGGHVDAEREELLHRVQVSNLVDDDSQALLRESLDKQGVPQVDIDLFLSQVGLYNSTVKGASLVPQGFVPLGQVSYDAAALGQSWMDAQPSFIGQNCRISTFQLAHSLLSATPNSPDTSALFVDEDALRGAPAPLIPAEERAVFDALYGRVEAPAGGTPQAHAEAMRRYFASQALVFPSSEVALVSVVFHDVLDEPSRLFIGHIGVLVPAVDGQGLLFVEKLSFEEPFQMLRVSSPGELSAVLMSRYDVDTTGESVPPVVLLNDAVIEGYAPASSTG